MRKNIFLGSMTIILALGSAGCSTSDEYRCESNDLCSTTTDWKYYSCSNETGHCEKVDPLAIDRSTLPDATIGQSDYLVELTASGRISPYTFSLARENEEKLKWLTITPEGENKAILHNSTGPNNEPLVPTDLNDGIPLTVTITLVDSSKHGTAVREDNQGKAFQMTIKINDCNGDNCDNGDNSTTPIEKTRCSNGIIKTCNQDSLKCASWVGEDNCPTGVCQTEGLNAYILCCDSQNNCGNSTLTQCRDGWIEVCSKEATGCLVWTQDRECPNQSECKPDGSSCIDCIDECPKSGDHQCSSNNTSINTCEINITTGCLGWSLFGQCDTGKTCVDATCKYVVGNTGAGGGRIFWVNSDGSQYLEATLQDQSSGAQWGCMNYTMGSSGQGIGNGENNTSAIVSNCSDTGIAAKLCSGQNLGNGYTDWFLPSHDELKEMYNMKAGIGGFASSAYGSSWYWSSSEYVDNSKYYAMDVNFNDPRGFVSMATKASSEHVRCVRSGP